MTASAALFCLAMAVYHESRGQPVIGQIAVAHVIINRARSKVYPDNVCSVVTQPSQFPFQWDPPLDVAAWETAVKIADDALSGRSFDPTHGALHYHRYDVTAAWSKGMEGIPIGDHLFFRRVN